MISSKYHKIICKQERRKAPGKSKKKEMKLNGTYDKLCLCKFYGIHLIIWIPYD